jgi:hypothetical protein
MNIDAVKCDTYLKKLIVIDSQKNFPVTYLINAKPLTVIHEEGK